MKLSNSLIWVLSALGLPLLLAACASPLTPTATAPVPTPPSPSPEGGYSVGDAAVT